MTKRVRRFVIAIALFAVLACSLHFVSAPVQAADAAKPNIIFIMADDLGYGDLGSFGQKIIQTPRLDEFAAEGMTFTDFYAGSTVCAPSRCVLMTGLHLGHCFIRGNGKDNLRPSDFTVAELLKSAGYATGLAGKWGLGHEGSTGLPTRQGFDSFFGYLDQHHAHNYYPEFLIHNEERYPLRNELSYSGQYNSGVAKKKVDYSPDFVIREALDFVERHKDGPFFLYLPHTLPHANNEARNQIKNGAEVPDFGIYADKPWDEPTKGHAAMITYLDTQIGQLMDRLKALGIDDETIVMFTSDNGPHAESGHDPEFFDANGPLKGLKRDLYEGGIRVPTMVRWPGHVAAGTKSSHIGYFGDLMATAAELAGTTPPAGLDSISFAPTFLGHADQQQEHKYLYWEFYERGSAQAVRMGHWKAVRKPMLSGPIELYDLANDIGEDHDVAGSHPDVVARMLAAMEEAHVPAERWKIR